MCPSPESTGQSGGVNISGRISTVAGDIVGGHKIGSTAEEIVAVLEGKGVIRTAETAGLERQAIVKIAQRLKPDLRDFDQAVRELEHAVTVAVDYARLLGFTYLVDRESQAADLIAALETWAAGRHLPIIGVAAGAAEHRHELLIERFAKEGLRVDFASEPILLGGFARLQIPSLDFPFGPVEFPERQYQDFIRGVAGKVCASRRTAAAVREAINNTLRMPCAFSSTIYVEHYDRDHKKLLELWLDFWDEVGAETLRYPVCLFLCIRQATPPARIPLPLIQRFLHLLAGSGQPRRLRRPVTTNAEAIRREVVSLAMQRRYVMIQTFRSFTDITRKMVRDWLVAERLASCWPELGDRRLAIEESIASKLPTEAFPLDRLCVALHELAG